MKLTKWFPGDVKPVHIGVYERLTIERDEARRTAREAHEMGTRVVAQRDALLEALKDIAGTDPVDAALDPQRAVRIARAAITALRAALAEQRLTDAQQAEQAEPVAWEGWWLHHGQHNYRAKPLSPERVKELMKLAFEVGREAAPSQQAEPVAWLRVIDEAMVTHHLGVADPGDDYETAKRKMNVLLCMAQDIGTYFAKQAEPLQEPVAWAGCGECDSSFPCHDGKGSCLRLPLQQAEPVAWLFEDTLPDEYPYDAMWPYSSVCGGVRMFPVFAPPQRKPLTQEEAATLVVQDNRMRGEFSAAMELIRRTERAHNIKE